MVSEARFQHGIEVLPPNERSSVLVHIERHDLPEILRHVSIRPESLEPVPNRSSQPVAEPFRWVSPREIIEGGEGPDEAGLREPSNPKPPKHFASESLQPPEE